MLTKTDLQQIGKVIDEKLDIKLKPIKTDVGVLKQDLTGLTQGITNLQKDMKDVKKDLKYIKKSVNLVVKNYDEGDVMLGKRVTKIEEHLQI